MKVIFVTVAVCLLSCARANNYYFSSLSGSDASTEMQAQNPSTPWKTLSKLNDFFSNLKPGDSVLLNRGETFYGSINLKQSGSSALPIFIGAYGTGKKPVITSLVRLTGWVSKGKGIWESYNPSLAAKIGMLLLNGVEYGMGRYPNKDAVDNGYLYYETHEGKTSITDKQLTSSINWTNAELVLRPRHWILERSLIKLHSGSHIYYDSTSPYEPYQNYGYFIQNSIKTLDQFGEWYYDPSTKKVSVYFGSSQPPAYVLEATTINNLIYSFKSSNVVFDNLTLKGANGSGVSILYGSNVRIQNCDILFSGESGLTSVNHDNLVIENCTISDQNNSGIHIPSGNYPTITNNRIINTYLVAGMAVNGEGMGNGINIYSNNSLVEYNEIKNTGYQGVHFRGSDVIIKNNLIDSFCLVKDDGAGIYANKSKSVYTRRKIIGNIILNGIGMGKGTSDSFRVAAHGIYMDNNASEAEIIDNTIGNCGSSGIYIHNSFGMTIKNNTLFNNRIQLNMIEDADNVPIRDCLITGNIFFSKIKEQWVSTLKTSADDINDFGRFDSNYYARPLNDRVIIFNSFVAAGGKWTVNSFDLDGWKEAYGQDLHSKKTAKQIVPFTISSLVGDNKFANGGDFTGDIKGVSATACVVSHGTSGMLDNGYLQVAPSKAASSVSMKVGQVSKDKKYVLSFSLKGTPGNNVNISALVRKAQSPYTIITSVSTRAIKAARTENEIIFSPSATESSASLEFKVDNQSKYYIDNVDFYEAIAKITNPDDSIRFVYNATKENQSIGLSGSYIDTRGVTYTNTIVLAPYTSAVLIKTNNVAQNIAPTVSISSAANNAKLPAFSSALVNAVAADADGSIAKVEFFNGPVLLKTENKPSYECALDSMAPGNYTITAKATDNKGLATTSSPVVFSVLAPALAPQVSITTPADSSAFLLPATINIAATATDADGSISKVEFFNGGTLLITEFKAPYTYTWQNVPVGNFTITAKATDNMGLVTISLPVKVSVKAPLISKVISQRTKAIADDAHVTFVAGRSKLSN